MSEASNLGFTPERALTFGGYSCLGGKLKVVCIQNEYADLYRDAINSAKIGMFGYPTASLEHIAAMKHAMRGGHHRLDLEWILLRKQTDFIKLRDLVYKHVGGRFGVDCLEDIKAQAEMEAALDVNRTRSSYP